MTVDLADWNNAKAAITKELDGNIIAVEINTIVLDFITKRISKLEKEHGFKKDKTNRISGVG